MNEGLGTHGGSPRTGRVQRVSRIETEDALIVVDGEKRIHAISSGLCEQMGVSEASFQGKALDQIERSWHQVAILYKTESEGHGEQTSLVLDDKLSLLRVHPRLDVLLQGATAELPQALTCNRQGQVIGASLSLLNRPGGLLLKAKPLLVELLPSAARSLHTFMVNCFQQRGVPSALQVQIPKLGKFRICGLANSSIVELSFDRPAVDVLGASELIRHPVFHRSMDLMAEAVTVHDLDGATLQVNQAGRLLLGAEQALASVPQLVDAIYPDDRSVFAGLLAAALRGATTRAVMRLRVGSDERLCHSELTVRPIRREDGELDRLLVLTRSLEHATATDAALAPSPVAGADVGPAPTAAHAAATVGEQSGRADTASALQHGTIIDAASASDYPPDTKPQSPPQGYAWSCELRGDRLIGHQLHGDGFEQLHGFPFEQLALVGGKRLAMPAEEAQRVHAAITQAQGRGSGFELEFARYDERKALRWSLMRGVLVQNPDGRQLVHAVTLDLQPQRGARLAHDQHHRHLLALADLLPTGGGFQLRFDAQGRVGLVFANDRLRQLCPHLRSSGSSASELLFPGLDSETAVAIDQRLRQAARGLDLVEYEFTLSDGATQRHYSIFARGADVDHGASVDGLLIETSERVHAERGLRERVQLLQRIANNLPNGFIFQLLQRSNGEACMGYVSAGFERLTEISRRDIALSLTPLLHLMSAADAMSFESRMRESARRMVPLECEFGLTSDRREAFRHLQLCARPRPHEGGSTLWEGVVVDISSRHRQGEEQRRLILRLEHQITELESVNFALSHDLKGAVLGLRGQLDLADELAEQGLLSRVRERIERSIGVTDRMWQLLAQMLELSRLERAELVIRRLPILELVQPTLELLAGLAEHSGVRVELASPELEFDCDVLRMQSVLVNVIGNALKFSPPGSAPVVISGTESATEVTLIITDHGIGIDPPLLEQVFELFERIDPAMEGSGVGLALARRVVAMHGGKVWASSDGLDQGTTISISLPRADAVRSNADTLVQERLC